MSQFPADGERKLEEYNNCCLTMLETGRQTGDPYVIRALGKYYLTYTAGDRIEICPSDTLINFKDQIHVVWRPPPNTDYSNDIWAPELHPINGRWHIYFAADHPRTGNFSHRMFVIGGPPSSQDPCDGPWEFLGRLKGLPDTQWAIDGTVFPLNDKLYFAYSGWPLDQHHSDAWQCLFLAEMVDATHCRADRPPTCISKPTHRHEITTDGGGQHGINEGPQWLVSPNGVWAGLIYSCAASWCTEYKMAILQYMGGDPLDARMWNKHPVPLCQTAPGRGPYGPGHGNFVNENGEVIAVFHATDSPHDGFANRRARLQRVGWNEYGPYMGGCVGKITTSLDAFRKTTPQADPPMSAPGAHRGFRGVIHSAKDKVRNM